MRHTRQQRDPQALRRQSPSHRNWFARESAIRLSVRPPPVCCQEASYHPGRVRQEGSWHPIRALPLVAWFQGHWQKLPRRSIGKELDCARGNLATHTIEVTSEYPIPLYPRILAGRTLANHRANHSVAGRDARSEDPTASRKNS